MLKVVLILVLFISISLSDEDYCETKDICLSKLEPELLSPRFIFYDVNKPEGFNLRRDVYMRMAIMSRKLSKIGNWKLVLPPWPHLYHWTSLDLEGQTQSRLPWGSFFNVSSLKQFAPVIEMSEFLSRNKTVIDQVYILQHFQHMFETGNFEDRLAVEECQEPNDFYWDKNRKIFSGEFWGYSNLSAKSVNCLSFHGHASQLLDVLSTVEHKAVMIQHAEVVLHDRFGNKEYWDARRSMQFAEHLVTKAKVFLQDQLNTTYHKLDGVGGPYICVHLRRKDFLRGRHKQIPSLRGAAQQITKELNRASLDTVFVATDAPHHEKSELAQRLHKLNTVFYEPDWNAKIKLKDGGVAIVEQIICSHARKFLGSHESTFSFRIQEEREILGLASSTTFNRLCGDNESKCKQPAAWTIVS